jgi:EpsI family protein
LQKRLTVLFGLLAVTFGALRATTQLRVGSKRSPDWSKVPYELSGWQGKETTFDPVYGSDPADASLLRVYWRAIQPPIIVYVGFYGNLPTIMENHTPELCYPAQGWTIWSSGRSSGGMFRGKPVRTQEIVATKDGATRLVTWWYNAGSRPFETRVRYIYAMWVLSMLKGRTDGSFVRIETPISKGEESAARTRIDEFQKSFLPFLEKVLP